MNNYIFANKNMRKLDANAELQEHDMNNQLAIQDRTINVCFALDNNYVDTFLVALTSICYNAAADDILNIYLLACDLTDDSKVKIESCLIFENVRIVYCDITASLFKELPVNEHISSATYARLLITKILPENLNKVLYLDCDIIVTSSLYDLYSTNVENCALAAVLDIRRSSSVKHLAVDYEIYIDNYFNAGVLLINLHEWEKIDFIKEASKICAIKTPLYWDQDILNIIFSKYNIIILDINYNFQYFFAEFEQIGLQLIHDKMPIVIHYASNRKPQLCSFLWHATNQIGKIFYFYLRLVNTKLALPPFPLNIPYNSRILFILFDDNNFDIYKEKILAIQDDAYVECKVINNIMQLENIYIDYSIYDVVFISEKDYSLMYGFKGVINKAKDADCSVYLLSRNGNSLTPLYESNSNRYFGRGEHFIKNAGLPEYVQKEPPYVLPLIEFQRLDYAIRADKYIIVYLSHAESAWISINGVALNSDNISKPLTSTEVIHNIRYIHDQALDGKYICYVPISENMYHVPVGNINSSQLDNMLKDGYSPASIVEISANSFQCVINFPLNSKNKKIGYESYLTRYLNKRYGGCIKSSQTTMFLPGFKSHEDISVSSPKVYPYIRIHEAKYSICNGVEYSNEPKVLYSMHGPCMIYYALIYHYLYNSDKRCVILIDNYARTCNHENILNNLVDNEIIDDYIITRLYININELTSKQQAINTIISFYDDLFHKNGHDIHEFDEVITINDTHDSEINLYYNLKMRPYIWLQPLKDSKPMFYHRASLSPIITQLLEEYNYIDPNALYARPVMYHSSSETLKDVSNKFYGLWDANDALLSIDVNIISRIMNAYGLDCLQKINENSVLILPDSYGHGTVADDRNDKLKLYNSPILKYIPRERYHARLALALDLCAEDTDQVYVKSHPSDDGIMDGIKINLINNTYLLNPRIPFQILQMYLVKNALKFNKILLFASLELSHNISKICNKLYVFGPSYNDTYFIFTTLYTVYKLASLFNKNIVSHSSMNKNPYYDSIIESIRLFNHLNGNVNKWRYNTFNYSKPHMHLNSFIIVDCLEITNQDDFERICNNVSDESILCFINMKESDLSLPSKLLSNLCCISLRHEQITGNQMRIFGDTSIYVYSKNSSSLTILNKFSLKKRLKRLGVEVKAYI